MILDESSDDHEDDFVVIGGEEHEYVDIVDEHDDDTHKRSDHQSEELSAALHQFLVVYFPELILDILHKGTLVVRI